MQTNEFAAGLKNIRFTVNDGIAVVTMNRPKAMNALNYDTLRELSLAMDHISGCGEIGGVIITGEGKAFVAGADISQMSGYSGEQAREWSGFAQGVFNKVESLSRPVIAAVNGYALGGGCELAMSCDMRIASEKAVFGQPEVNLGVIPCFGGTQRLPRLVGTGMAKELIYTGRNVSAREAKEIGLVNRVVPPEELMSEAESVLRLIMSRAPKAVACAKTAVNQGINMDLIRALELEKDVAALAFATDDAKEGMAAFLEKREPHFKDR